MIQHNFSVNIQPKLFIVGFTFLINAAAFCQTLFDPIQLVQPEKFGAELTEKLSVQEVYEFKSPMGNCVLLKNGFRQSGFKNANEWLQIKDSVVVERVDIVYSKYPVHANGYREIYSLLFKRINATITMDPALNSDSILWRRVLQTHCENNEQVNQLYHGVVIWYQPIKKSKTFVPEPAIKITTPKKPKSPLTSSTPPQKTEAAPPKYVEFILSHPSTPDSLKLKATELTPSEKEKLVQDYYHQESQRNPAEKSIENPIVRLNYMKAVESFMKQFPKVDPVVGSVLDRHPEWTEKIVVNDWTGSMYGYGSQVLLWHLVNLDSSGIETITLFNDGNSKSTANKVIGKTGGIYTEKANNASELIELFSEVMRQGGGGDGPENDIEAILKATKSNPRAEIILIADNSACVRDIELAEQISRPVRIILCGYNKEEGVNPDYIYLAKITGGGIYTIEEDLENLAVEIDEKGMIQSYEEDRLKLSAPQCFDAVFGRADGRRYTLKKARFHKKKVKILDASNEQLSSIPSYIYKMSNLQSLNINNNQLTEITAEVLQIRILSVLNISNNQIISVTDKIDRLRYLEYFYAGNNQLSKVPEGLFELDFIKELDLSNNKISSFDKPDSKVLERINLSGNQLNELPSLLRNRGLIELNVASNNLTEFPEKIPLKNLEHLDVSNNSIETLPENLVPYKKLESLNLKGNPISEEERIRIREALITVDLIF